MICGAALLDGHLQVRRRLGAPTCSVSTGSKRLAPGADARVGEQIVDQALHALGAVDGEADELVGVLVQLALVAPRQQLHVAGHHAQRLLQVVRGHVGELLELGVRARQLLLGALALVDLRGQLLVAGLQLLGALLHPGLQLVVGPAQLVLRLRSARSTFCSSSVACASSRRGALLVEVDPALQLVGRHLQVGQDLPYTGGSCSASSAV